MIFPSENLLELRAELQERLDRNEVDEVQAYRQALAADPMDPRALRQLALFEEDEDNYAEATELAWRWLRADPLSHEVFLLIGRMLARDPEQAGRGRAYRALGQEKLHFDPEAESEYVPPPDFGAESEMPEVTHELEPHRLLHRMWVAGPEDISRELVDQILARGADMSPLLVGVLNLYAEDLVDEIDDALTARAVTLLGDIDTPDMTDAIRAILEFVTIPDEFISGIGQWALQRIAFRRPADVLVHIREYLLRANALDSIALAKQICLMPPVEGRAAALQIMLDRLPEFDRESQSNMLMAALMVANAMHGVGGTLAASIEEKYGHLLDAASRREYKSIKRSMKDEGPYVAQEDPRPVHDLVCQSFDPVDEDEDQPFVRAQPKIGRNDPCWCGSGKKYKKCHLAADESR